ncbi:MAG TPA: PrgI family protein [Pseudonocardiaceae bacterium]|nr:PrgI family protein [Pseudonocardiaceae bacterium]
MSEQLNVKIPADVDRPDRILAGLTARQVAILAVTAAALYLGWLVTRTLVPGWLFVAAAVPVVVAGIALAIGRRDGTSVETLARAALLFHIRPRLLRHRTHREVPAPGWAAARAHHSGAPKGRAGTLRLPAQAIEAAGAGVGAVDLGGDGMAVIAAASTVNFALRTESEQAGLVDCFARLLHAQTAPLQILVRAQPLDLGPALGELAEAAAALPHPALRAAAAGHQQWLAGLAATRTLLARQVLLVLREPSRPGAEARLARRLEDARRALAPAEITLTALDTTAVHAVLAAATDPTNPHLPAGLPGGGVSAQLAHLLYTPTHHT